MKLLLIVHNQVNTGPFVKIFEMCIAISKLGNKVTLVCTSKSNKFTTKQYIKESVKIIESPDLFWGKFRQGIDLWNAFNRYRLIRKQKYDLIHAIDCRPVVILPSLALKWKLKIPLVLSWWDLFGTGGTMLERSGKFYSSTIGVFESWFETYFRKYADRATVLSSSLYDRLVELNYPKNKISLIRVGSTIPKSSLNKSNIKKKLRLPKNVLVLCYLGTLFTSDRKLLLNALEIVKSKVNKPPLIVLIGNHHIPEPICNNLNIRQTGFLESKNEVNEYLAVSDLSLLPMHVSAANKARWPSKVADYWGVGLPVVTTAISDFVEIFKEQPMGFISKSDSPSEFAATIISAINLTKAERTILSKNALEYFKNELDWSVIALEQLNLYKSLINC